MISKTIGYNGVLTIFRHTHMRLKHAGRIFGKMTPKSRTPASFAAFDVCFSHWESTDSNHMGVSENSVPLNPMILLIIIPTKWLLIGNIPYFQTNPYFMAKCHEWLSMASTKISDEGSDLQVWNHRVCC